MLKTALCILIVLPAVVVPEVAGDTCTRYIGSGCRYPGGLPFMYHEQFSDACNRHNVCYYCGKTRGVSRSTCDDDLLVNMKKTCRFYTTYCQLIARVYYRNVIVDLEHRYSELAHSQCGENWVSGCMPVQSGR